MSLSALTNPGLQPNKPAPQGNDILVDDSNIASQTPGAISVIVPVYNAAPWLDECISSLTGQTHEKLQIIFVNDGSTDQSGAILEKWSADPRITILRCENNGVSAARNLGFKMARGEFVIFADADDILAENALASLYKIAHETGADITVGGFTTFLDGEGKPSSPTLVFPDDRVLGRADLRDYVITYLNQPNKHPLFVYSWGRLFRSSMLHKAGVVFDEGLSAFEDVSYNFDTLVFANSLAYVASPVVHHLLHPLNTSATSSFGKNPAVLFGFLKALASVQHYLENTDTDTLQIEQRCGNARIAYTVIQLIRLCGSLKTSNFFTIYKFVHGLIRRSAISDGLKHYSSRPGESAMIPRLIRYQLTLPLLLVCYDKARKRYG